VDDNKFGVPAGWYPDPLGLPQLRWWDAQAWTEHTSEARAPIVIQPATRVAFADDDELLDHNSEEGLPSRRDLRDRERRENGSLLESETLFDTDTDGTQGELSAQPLLAMTLLELEPPLGDDWDGAAPGPRSASSHANAAPAASTLSAMAEEAPERAPKRMRTYTFSMWLIALMPLLQLATMLALIIGAGLGSNVQLMVAIVVFPYLLVIGLAFYDRLLLQTWGHQRPASAFWSLLREPAYLVARAVRTFRETGKGFAPIAIWASSLGAVLAGILIFPGLLLSVAPAVFAQEAQVSVQADAAALGADITVTCPAPPLFIGQLFTCVRTSPDGTTDSVAVSLQRENGWISWRVEDWGNAVMAQLGS
jgi:hypothetical protein